MVNKISTYLGRSLIPRFVLLVLFVPEIKNLKVTGTPFATCSSRSVPPLVSLNNTKLNKSDLLLTHWRRWRDFKDGVGHRHENVTEIHYTKGKETLCVSVRVSDENFSVRRLEMPLVLHIQFTKIGGCDPCQYVGVILTTDSENDFPFSFQKTDFNGTDYTIGDWCTPLNVNLINFMILILKSRSDRDWCKIHEPISGYRSPMTWPTGSNLL